MKAYFLWLAKLITITVFLVVVIPVGIATISATAGSIFKGKDLDNMLEGQVSSKGKNSVAVIELNGMITSSKEVVKKLYKQAQNKSVRGIVLRIDSPGGAVGPSQDIYNAVKEIKKIKPVVASMGSVAASGGLYAALSASKVYCQPGTLTGSIGVIMQVPNFTKVVDKFGVEMITIKSGKFKDTGNAFRPMTADDKELLQGTINRVEDDFVAAVVEGRGISEAEVRKFADGRVIVGSQALELKLVDGLGGIYTAARAVFDILGESLAEDEIPNLIYVEDKISKFRKLLEGVTELPVLIKQFLSARGAVSLNYL